MKELVDYWRTGYDWRKQERALNNLDHFKTKIDGLDMHFIHVRSKHEHALPLVITHGWPGSFYEFYKIIGPLTDPVAYGGRAEDAFHVVIPSLPGFGFSDKPAETGWSNGRMAHTISRLMQRLGYDRYGAQGGDWGSSVSAWLGRNDAERCIAIHLNFVTAGPPTNVDNPLAKLSPDQALRLRERQQWAAEEFAYNQIQGTRPQTLGYGLNDSPAGLAAWIVEKFRAWSDCDGDVERQFTKDELLTNVMIYWVSESIASSTRVYYESRHSPGPGKAGRVEVPVGCAIFPKEIVYAPREWVEQQLNVTHWTEMPAGGHFAALEEPELLVQDVREFFRTVR
jgi:pimeloyl-ACP methyl ester carboxylesterase